MEYLSTGRLFRQDQQEAVNKACGISVMFIAIAGAMQGMLYKCSARSTVMIAPSGFTVNPVRHIREPASGRRSVPRGREDGS